MNHTCYISTDLCLYLLPNFFNQNVLGRVRDDIVLAAICCLTLAWKVRNQAFRFIYFEVSGYIQIFLEKGNEFLSLISLVYLCVKREITI